VVLAGLILGAAAPAAAGEDRHLVLGRITQEPDKNVDRLNAMAEYLGARLASDGIETVKIAVAETPEEMSAMLRDGRVDLFSETPFFALELMEQGLAEPLMREWKEGVAEYHAVIIARRESDVRSLADLLGQKFAFEDAGSTSGYLLPRAALEASGLLLAELDNPRGEPGDGRVGYSFDNGEINVVAWVNRGLADAGAISNLDWEDPETAPEHLRNGLTVIYETESVTRSLMMVRRDLDAEVKRRLAIILEHMHETPEGQTALRRYFKVSRYDRLQGDTDAGMEAARAAWRKSRSWNE
jgi:phosphonate transport system substrate-binding protein